MKIFLIAPCVPCRDHGTRGIEAVHIIVYHLLAYLQEQGNELALQVVYARTPHDPVEVAAFTAGLEHLKSRGVTVFDPLSVDRVGAAPAADKGKFARLLDLVRGRVGLERYYPSVGLTSVLKERITRHAPDIIYMHCSPEGVAATYDLEGIPKITFQGDIDFIPTKVRFEHPEFFMRSSEVTGGLASLPVMLAHHIKQRLLLAEFESAHLATMAAVDVIANNAANNALYYSRHGHPRSVYIRNPWKRPPAAWSSQRAPTQPPGSRQVKIIGHMGNLATTGSTFGLRYLLKEVMPELERSMRDFDYKVYVIGAGRIADRLKPLLHHPRVVTPGFVADLDAEVIDSDVVLFLNNAGPYQTAFTRHMVTWSLGGCLIVSDKSRIAIPEIRHRYNALCGSAPAEIADLVREAVTDQTLNRSLREQGLATYEEYFTPEAVATALYKEMGAVVKKAVQ
ncbi:MAG: glycosyltransferase [Elusimicrobiota bacterium]